MARTFTKLICCMLVVLVEGVLCLATTSNKKPSVFRLISKKHGTSTGPTYIFHDDGNSAESSLTLSRNDETKDIHSNFKKIKPLLSKNFPTPQLNLFLKRTFLPSGFPSETPPGYLSYSIWSWIQDLSTQLRAVIATQKVLEGIGVGRDGATALSASLNFIVRDGCGMIASLLFTALASSKFRSDVKRWRIFADIINDVGISLEMSATLVSQKFFLLMICLGNMCKALCGVASGACGGVINLHWAQGSDISDINAKFGAQHTVTGALGLVFAAIFAKTVSNLPQRNLFCLFLTLTYLHIYANMKCMKLISFNYLNIPRMDLIIKMFLSDIDIKGKEKFNEVDVSSPDSICKTEPLIFDIHGGIVSRTLYRIKFGVSFDQFWNTHTSAGGKFDPFINNIKRYGYYVTMKNKRQINGERLNVYVILSNTATQLESVKAYFHAHLLGHYMAKAKVGDGIHSKTNDVSNIENEVITKLNVLWPIFENKTQYSGWDLEKTDLQTEGYNVEIKEF